jgi:phage gpG-like protein
VANTITVRISGRRAALTLQRHLGDTDAALTSIGAIVRAQALRAFEEQRFAGVVWKERYPGQREPFINVAPVVRKAGRGNTPTADDFRRRPALGGVQSDLANSIAWSVSGNAVEIGTTFPDASIFQFGGKAKIDITDTTRATLARWLGVAGTGTPRKRNLPMGREVYLEESGTREIAADADPDGPWVEVAGFRRRTRRVSTPGGPLEYGRKLAFVFNPDRTSYEPEAAARPFVGFTDETMNEILGSLAEWLGGEVS